jgi:hypothetical protein
VRGFSEARPELVRAASVSVSRSARAAAFGLSSEVRVTAESSSETWTPSSRLTVVDPVASGSATSRAAMRTPGAPPITKTTAQAHPKNIETPHTSIAARLADHRGRGGRSTGNLCVELEFRQTQRALLWSTRRKGRNARPRERAASCALSSGYRVRHRCPDLLLAAGLTSHGGADVTAESV